MDRRKEGEATNLATEGAPNRRRRSLRPTSICIMKMKQVDENALGRSLAFQKKMNYSSSLSRSSRLLRPPSSLAVDQRPRGPRPTGTAAQSALFRHSGAQATNQGRAGVKVVGGRLRPQLPRRRRSLRPRKMS